MSIQQIFPPINDHAKLRAPVADVIVTDHFVPKKLRDAGERIAEHDAADVTDVHRFGHVGRPEINHNPLVQFCFGDAEPLISQNLAGFFGDRVGTQCEVNKAGACDGWRFAKIGNIKTRDNFLCESSGIFAALFAEHERGIGLVISKTRIGRRRYFAGIREADLRQPVGELLRKKCLEGLHERGASLQLARQLSNLPHPIFASDRERSIKFRQPILLRPNSHGRCDRSKTWQSRQACAGGSEIDFWAQWKGRQT